MKQQSLGSSPRLSTDSNMGQIPKSNSQSVRVLHSNLAEFHVKRPLRRSKLTKISTKISHEPSEDMAPADRRRQWTRNAIVITSCTTSPLCCNPAISPTLEFVQHCSYPWATRHLPPPFRQSYVAAALVLAIKSMPATLRLCLLSLKEFRTERTVDSIAPKIAQ